MPQNFSFTFSNVRPSGWTAQTIAPPPQPSAVGPVNAAAQNPVTADVLRTTPSTLADPSLGSRQFMNPNTGIRDVAASGSVYKMSDVPPYLSQAVASLNAEQALRRSAQAELQNRIVQGASSGGPDAYLWLEALRAAAVSPGSSVAFGRAIQNPAFGTAARTSANAAAATEAARAQAIGAYNWNLNKQQLLESNPTSSNYWEVQAQRNQTSARAPLALASASRGGSTISGWTPGSAIPTNSFQPGYRSYWS